MIQNEGFAVCCVTHIYLAVIHLGFFFFYKPPIEPLG